jgi:L-arabinose isomerase
LGINNTKWDPSLLPEDAHPAAVRNLRVGVFGIGLEAYWSQFVGLRERLEGYLSKVAARLARPGIDVINTGLIDTPQAGFAAGNKFREAGIDLLFLYVSTYALSATVIPVVRRARVPIIVLNLAPSAAIDYVSFNRLPDRQSMTGEWLAFCQSCPLPEIANVFHRSKIPFLQVTGTLDDSTSWQEIDDWLSAAQVAHIMESNCLGVMGHYYGGMLDIYSDLTQHCLQFGGHIEFIEVEELTSLRGQVTAAEMVARVAYFHQAFDIQADCPREELEVAAVTSVALDRLVARLGLGSMTYYYRGTGNSASELAISSIILGTSLLTARGIPVAGEYEIKNVQAMKIMGSFGAGGSFTEYYANDFAADVVLMGHDGPGHIAIAEGKTKVRPLSVYHGKVGRGLSVEMSVKHGPVTLLSVAEDGNGRLRMVTAEGESVAGPVLAIGNTNSRYRFAGGAKRFIESWNAAGPAHHCAVGVGHIAGKIEKLGMLLQMETLRVC